MFRPPPFTHLAVLFIYGGNVTTMSCKTSLPLRFSASITRLYFILQGRYNCCVVNYTAEIKLKAFCLIRHFCSIRYFEASRMVSDGNFAAFRHYVQFVGLLPLSVLSFGVGLLDILSLISPIFTSVEKF